MSARILVVGSEGGGEAALAARLSSAYFDVRHAERLEAATAAASGDPDVILVNGEGEEPRAVCRELKAACDAPVVLVGGESRLAGFEAGADDVFSDPPKAGLLIARLRSLARLKAGTDDLRRQSGTERSFGEEASLALPGRLGAIVSEDEARLLAGMLEGVCAVERQDAEGVLEAAATGRMDLALASLGLKGGGGLSACGRLRAARAMKSVPLIVLGSEGQTLRVARALELGADDYLINPFDRKEARLRIGVQLRRKRYRDALRGRAERRMGEAMLDPLTGLRNRRWLDARLPELIARAAAGAGSLGVILIDLDRFKQVNDAHGHEAGDGVLRRAAALLRSGLRRGDLVCRMGGDEFLAVLPGADKGEARMSAERLRASFEGSRLMGVTLSAGAAALDLSGSLAPEQTWSEQTWSEQAWSEQARSLVRQADAALYRAKRGGKNRVES